MKRWFSGLLAAVMVLLLLPASASGTESFYAYLYSNPTTAVGETALVGLYLGQNSTSQEYNTYFFQIDYDAEKLTFTSATIGSNGDIPDIINNNSDAGLLTIGGYGELRSDRFITLNFTVKAAGEATVKLVKAQMDVRANAAKDAQAAGVPTGQSNTVTILCGGFPVVLPDCATGAAYVTENGDYTFTADPGYNYDFSATVDNEKVDIINNRDGSYTIKNVTGELVISANSTPTVKTYEVTVEGDGSGDVSAPTSATHGRNYTFTVTQAANYDYAVAVTVNGQPVTCTVSSSGRLYTYTIPAAVTGPVVITVKKAPQSGTTQIVLTGSGAADVWDGVTSYTVKSGEAFTFGISHQEGFDYTVTVMAGEKTLTLQRNENASTYTIPEDYIKGGIIMVSITKTAQLALTVNAAEYVKLINGNAVWLITAVPETKLPATKSLYYGNAAMFWSEKYEAYAWLLVDKGTAADIAAAAKSAISVKGNSTVSVSYGGDVNGTGHTDINDAQYVYDLYNAKHSALDMEKFLRCDVNGDREVNVEDVRMVVSLLLR